MRTSFKDFLFRRDKKAGKAEAAARSNDPFDGGIKIEIVETGNGQGFASIKVNGEEILSSGASTVKRAFVEAMLKDVFARGMMPGGKPQTLWNDAAAGELVDAAKQIVANHSNTRFVGIGNSPSYVIYGIECLTQGTGVKTGYVPFSERYLDRVERVKGAMAFTIEKNEPTYHYMQRNRAAYRRFLTGLGMEPKKIVADFHKDGQRTALIDNIQYGGSFASFVHFMYEWAKDTGIRKDQFDQAVACIGLNDTFQNPPLIAIVDNGLTVNIDVMTISPGLRSALTSKLSCDIDRFIPPYPSRDWGFAPRMVSADNFALSKKIKGMIADKVTGEAARPAAKNAARAQSSDVIYMPAQAANPAPE